VFYSGLGVLALGAVMGGLAYLSNGDARTAQDELKSVSNPIFPAESREGPIAEIEKQNKMTLAYTIVAGAAGIVGAALLIAGVVPKRKRHASIQWRSGWGFAASF
jgi:hypothetical protein